MALGIKCYGKVQGVFFRASAKTAAEDLELCGWVRNEPDGTVLIHAEGNDKNLDEFLKWCHTGSQFASVNDVKSWPEKDEDLATFEIRRN